MESCYEEEQKISIDPNYISFNGKTDSNSLTDREYEKNYIGNKKAIVLQAAKEVGEQNLKNENKMVREEGIKNNKCNTVKEAQKALSPSLTKTKKDITILIPKKETEKSPMKNCQEKKERGNEEQIKPKNPKTMIKKKATTKNLT